MSSTKSGWRIRLRKMGDEAIGLRKAHITKKSKIMYIRLIRNEPKGNAITGRLVINGRWFCNTLERVGYQIPSLCYHVAVTMSPKFKRLLPLVCGVPSSVESCRIVEDSVESSSAEKTMLNHSTQPLHKATPCAMRSGIRFHRGTKPEHSTGCILVVADNKNKDNLNNLCSAPQKSADFSGTPPRPTLALAKGEQKLSPLPLSNVGEAEMLSMLSLEKTETLSSRYIPIGSRSAADVETQLTQLLLQAQKEHEEIILEVTDFRPGTELGYNTQCPPELQKP